MRKLFLPLVSLFACLLLGADIPATQPLTALPPAASHPIDFVKEIKPLFEASCIQCHAKGKDKGGLSIETRAAFVKGGDDGAVVIVGDSAHSSVVSLVAGTDPDAVMPKKGTRWTAEQVGLLRAWIDQGMKWDASVSFARPEPLNLKPRDVEVTVPSGGTAQASPIDELLEAYLKSKGIQEPSPVSDAVYCRRVYLDAIGLLPTTKQLEEFIADSAADKREKLVRHLLNDKANYAANWLTFWNDLLRNDYRGAGFIDGGRRQISGWLYASLIENKPYDQFVSELVNPDKASEGYSRGIIWRGSVNASQQPPVQAAQNISQVFMGVNLKCASCHDSFVSDFTLADAYGMAAIYSDTQLELIHCDKPTGKIAAPQFLYPTIGKIDPNGTRPQRLEALARIITSPQDGRLPRTIVNRLWQRLIGRGLVEPVDDMEKPAWDADLLDWMADDLVAHHYDLKHTIEVILTSRAYQLPSVEPAEGHGPYVFRGPTPRRLTAEQYEDAISSLSDDWARLPSTLNIDFTVGDLIGPVQEPKWIWTDEPLDLGIQRLHEQADKRKQLEGQIKDLQKQLDDLNGVDENDVEKAKAKSKNDPNADADKDEKDKDPKEKFATHRVIFRRHVTIKEVPQEAFAAAAASQAFSLSVNGKDIGSAIYDGERRGRIAVYNLKPALVAGDNVIVLSVSSHTEKQLNDDEFKLYPLSRHHVNSVSGTGFYLRAKFADGTMSQITTDATWRVRRAPQGRWKTIKFDDSQWAMATPLPDGVAPVDEGPGLEPIHRHDFANEPIDFGPPMKSAVSVAAQPGHIRASLLAADQLQTALGRPSREQVVTERSDAPNTLQALELTNGKTLDAKLRKTALVLAPATKANPEAWVKELYQHTLSRQPSEQELQSSLEMLKQPVTPDAVADYIWAITQLPEFQFLR